MKISLTLLFLIVSTCSTIYNIHTQYSDSSHVEISENELKTAAAKWILKIREGHRIPYSVMESIVLGASNLYALGLAALSSEVESRMHENSVSEEVIDSVKNVLLGETQYTIFGGLDSTFKQNEFIKANFGIVVSSLIMVRT